MLKLILMQPWRHNNSVIHVYLHKSSGLENNANSKKMKRILLMTALVVLATLGGSLRNSASAQANIDISYQDFYDELDPYGEWIDYPEYGYVWVPRESRGGGFRPYETNGHWVWSDDYEWMWVSDYSW